MKIFNYCVLRELVNVLRDKFEINTFRIKLLSDKNFT